MVLAMGSISVFVVANVDWYLETMEFTHIKADTPSEKLMCEWKYNPVPHADPNNPTGTICEVSQGLLI